MHCSYPAPSSTHTPHSTQLQVCGIVPRVAPTSEQCGHTPFRCSGPLPLPSHSLEGPASPPVAAMSMALMLHLLQTPGLNTLALSTLLRCPGLLPGTGPHPQETDFFLEWLHGSLEPQSSSQVSKSGHSEGHRGQRRGQRAPLPAGSSQWAPSSCHPLQMAQALPPVLCHLRQDTRIWDQGLRS